MSRSNIITFLLAALTILTVGCAGAAPVGRTGWPDGRLAADEANQSLAAEPSKSDTTPGARSLDPLSKRLEKLRQRNPAQYAALEKQLHETSTELTPQQQQLLPVLAATLNQSGRSDSPPEPAAQTSGAINLDQPKLNPIAPLASASRLRVTDEDEDDSVLPLRHDRAPSPEPSTQPSTQTVAAPTSPATPESQAQHREQEQERNQEQPNQHQHQEPADDSFQPGQWKATFASAIVQLEKELVWSELDDDQRARLEASLRLLYVIGNRRDKAVAPIQHLSEDEREYWKHQLYGLIVSLDVEDRHAPSRRAALALREFRSATDHLANMSALDVRNLAFCTVVDSYGRYQEFKSYTFQPGQEVVLYVEVENFSAAAASDHFETELQGEYTIYDAAGRRVENSGLPLDKQTCNNRRRDYFIAYRLYMPTEINAGKHTLVLTMEDIKGRKSNQASIEFEIR